MRVRTKKKHFESSKQTIEYAKKFRFRFCPPLAKQPGLTERVMERETVAAGYEEILRLEKKLQEADARADSFEKKLLRLQTSLSAAIREVADEPIHLIIRPKEPKL